MKAFKVISFLGALALTAAPAVFPQAGDDSLRPGLNQETAGTFGTSGTGTGRDGFGSVGTTMPGQDPSGLRSTTGGPETTGTTLSGGSTTGVTGGTDASGAGTAGGTGTLGGTGDGSDVASQGAGGAF